MAKYTQQPGYEITPSDKLFYQLMKMYPNKKGTSLELLSTAATKLMLGKGGQGIHDTKIVGHSGAKHQIDGWVDNVAIESKDHAAGEKAKPVGMKEVMEHEAAIGDIMETTSGLFFSSTDFTKDAIQYANGLSEQIHQKPIELVKCRPSSDSDLKGRIETIVINFYVYIPDCEYCIACDDETVKYLNSLDRAECQYMPILYDEQGHQTRTFDEAFDSKYDRLSDIKDGEIEVSDECIQLKNGKCVKLNAIKCNRTMHKIKYVDTIKGEGNPILLVHNVSSGFDKLLTDVALIEELKKLI